MKCKLFSTLKTNNHNPTFIQIKCLQISGCTPVPNPMTFSNVGLTGVGTTKTIQNFVGPTTPNVRMSS